MYTLNNLTILERTDIDRHINLHNMCVKVISMHHIMRNVFFRLRGF